MEAAYSFLVTSHLTINDTGLSSRPFECKFFETWLYSDLCYELLKEDHCVTVVTSTLDTNFNFLLRIVKLILQHSLTLVYDWLARNFVGQSTSLQANSSIPLRKFSTFYGYLWFITIFTGSWLWSMFPQHDYSPYTPILFLLPHECHMPSVSSFWIWRGVQIIENKKLFIQQFLFSLLLFSPSWVWMFSSEQFFNLECYSAHFHE